MPGTKLSQLLEELEAAINDMNLYFVFILSVLSLGNKEELLFLRALILSTVNEMQSTPPNCILTRFKVLRLSNKIFPNEMVLISRMMRDTTRIPSSTKEGKRGGEMGIYLKSSRNMFAIENVNGGALESILISRLTFPNLTWT